MSTEEKNIEITAGITWHSLIEAVERAATRIDGKSVCERDAMVLEGAAKNIRDALKQRGTARVDL